VAADPPTDAFLVERARSGDNLAFATLARRHGPRLARTIQAFGVEPSAVEDVAQLALVAAWRALADYDPARSFAAWVTVIGANKARDWRRSQLTHRRRQVVSHLDAPEARRARDPVASAEAMDDRIELRRVELALARLPEHLKTPLVLVSAAGFTQTEIAQALGVSLKTVETRIARGRAQLTKLLS
jgi:RNA polymerase sigma factor CnrH